LPVAPHLDEVGFAAIQELARELACCIRRSEEELECRDRTLLTMPQERKAIAPALAAQFPGGSSGARGHRLVLLLTNADPVY
jgi:hypothetical protein